MERIGSQTPRVSSVPDSSDYGVADEALEWLAEIAEFRLDEWQQMVLREALAERRRGSWAATEVGLVVPRQNGKGAILEARELIGLFWLRESLLIHSAHHFKTAQEHFLRLEQRILAVPELKARLAPGNRGIRRSHGEEGFLLRTGARLRFLARTKGGAGLGFSAPFVAFDEAQILPEEAIGAMVPTQSAMPRRQRWYTGTAPDQFVDQDSVVFARVRRQGLAGENPRLAFFEWSLDYDTPAEVPDDVMGDPEAWAAANPGYGIRIVDEAVEDELRGMGSRTFATMRLCVGDWPPVDGATGRVLDVERWQALADPDSRRAGDVVLSFDVTPDRSAASVGVAGVRTDGLLHVEYAKHERGTGWVVEYVADRVERHDPLAVVCDGAGPAASLVAELEDLGVKVALVSAKEYAQACGQFFDRVEQGTVRHIGQPDLLSAVKGATSRPLGDGGWAWSRKNSAVDISPLVSVTLAAWLARDDGGGIHIF